MIDLILTTLGTGEVRLLLGPRQWTARAHLVGAEETGWEPLLKKDPCIRRSWRMPDGTSAATIETWTQDPCGLRLSVTVESDAPSWSLPLEMALCPGEPGGLTWWAPWADPEPGQSIDIDTAQLANGVIADGAVAAPWRDPLVVRPWCPEAMLWLGAPMWRVEHQRVGFSPKFEQRIVAAPLVSALDAAAGTGLTLMASLDEPLLDMEAGLHGGALTLRHHRQRFGGGRTRTLTALISTHAAGWRSALAVLERRFPAYLAPPVTQNVVSGCGAYGVVASDLEAQTVAALGLGVLWKSFDFPYMGMFLPPCPDTASWQTHDGRTMDVPVWSAQQRRLGELGIACLDYFNVAEYGRAIFTPPDPVAAGTPLWGDQHAFLHERFPEAPLRPWPDPQGRLVDGRDAPGLGRCFESWWGCMAMDPGDPGWRAHLLEQAEAHVRRLPHSAGIAIDRFDWMRLYNPAGDDGVSWIDGRPARSLGLSWRSLATDLGAIFHRAGKVVFVNNHTKRLDYLRDVDGVFCEFAYAGPALNLSAFCSLFRPAIGWVATADQVLADPDAFLQRYLYMGVHPVAPFKGNDHCLLPHPQVDALYRDYGPMLDALRGRRWELREDAVRCDGARCNHFTVPDGRLVVLLGEAPAAVISLDRPETVGLVSVLRPGLPPVEVSVRLEGKRAIVTVPLHRGCALLQVMRRPRALQDKAPLGVVDGFLDRPCKWGANQDVNE